MARAYYSGLYSLLVRNYSLESKATGFNKCVLDQSHIMGRNVEQSLDSLCLRPASLIREERCTSRTITPRCRREPSLNKQGWYESHVSWLQEMRDTDPSIPAPQYAWKQELRFSGRLFRLKMFYQPSDRPVIWSITVLVELILILISNAPIWYTESLSAPGATSWNWSDEKLTV